MRRWINRCLALCAADILALVWAGLPAAAAAPTLTVDPSSGPCPVLHQTRVTLRGSGFTPGVQTRFVIRRDRDGEITAANSQAAGRRRPTAPM